jgi:hypothetical protein
MEEDDCTKSLQLINKLDGCLYDIDYGRNYRNRKKGFNGSYELVVIVSCVIF